MQPSVKEQILRIKQINLADRKIEAARAILQIPDSQPESTKNVTKYFRKLALLIHPDKVPPEDKAEATEAFQKIGQARDILLGAQNFQLEGPASDFEIFDPHSPQMTGPKIRQARDIILSFAFIFKDKPNYDVVPESNFDIPDNDNVTISSAAGALNQIYLILSANLDLGSDSIAQEDKRQLMEYVKLLFPPYYKRSENIATEFQYEDLENLESFLLNLVRRYPNLRKGYNNTFTHKTSNFLQKSLAALTTIIESSQLSADFLQNKQNFQFDSFESFARAFVGVDQVFMLGETEAEQQALKLLNDLVKTNPQLFSDLVSAANYLRSRIDADAQFHYSKTDLEQSHNAIRASLIDQKLCSGENQQKSIDVLNAQLFSVISTILGDKVHIACDAWPRNLLSTFPSCTYEKVRSYDNTSHRFVETNVLTSETTPVMNRFMSRDSVIVSVVHVTPEKSSFLSCYIGGYAKIGVNNLFQSDSSEFGTLRTPISREVHLSLAPIAKTWNQKNLTQTSNPNPQPSTKLSTTTTSEITAPAPLHPKGVVEPTVPKAEPMVREQEEQQRREQEERVQQETAEREARIRKEREEQPLETNTTVDASSTTTIPENEGGVGGELPTPNQEPKVDVLAALPTALVCESAAAPYQIPKLSDFSANGADALPVTSASSTPTNTDTKQLQPLSEVDNKAKLSTTTTSEITAPAPLHPKGVVEPTVPKAEPMVREQEEQQRREQEERVQQETAEREARIRKEREEQPLETNTTVDASSTTTIPENEGGVGGELPTPNQEPKVDVLAALPTALVCESAAAPYQIPKLSDFSANGADALPVTSASSTPTNTDTKQLQPLSEVDNKAKLNIEKALTSYIEHVQGSFFQQDRAELIKSLKKIMKKLKSVNDKNNWNQFKIYFNEQKGKCFGHHDPVALSCLKTIMMWLSSILVITVIGYIASGNAGMYVHRPHGRSVSEKIEAEIDGTTSSDNGPRF